MNDYGSHLFEGFVYRRLLLLFRRVRYPVSVPEDVGEALGVEFSSCLRFTEFMEALCDPMCRPTRLRRFMSRHQAEVVFASAIRKEQFPSHTLCSYHFNGNWMEFELLFDEDSRLRRLYVHHKDLDFNKAVEIPLLKSKAESVFA